MFKSHIPFAPKNIPFYYGWIIVPAAILGVLMSIPGQTAGFSAFTSPLIEALNISRSNLALSYFLGTISSGFILPKAGKLLDQFGTRPAVITVSLCLGIILTTFSYVESIIDSLTNVLSFLNSELIAIIILTALMLALRFFAQGMLPMISNTMIGRWFDKKRGKVVAVMGMVNAIAFNASPLFMSLLVSNFGWQMTWRYLSVIIAVFFLIFAWIFFRDNPESCELIVDGAKNDTNENSSPEMEGLDVDEAQKTITFKAITCALSLYAMTFTGIAFHLEAIGQEAGLSQTTTMGIFIPVTFITIPTGFLAAWLSDRIALKHLVIAITLFQAIGYFSFSFINTTVGFYSSIIFLGLTGGLFGPIMTIAFPWFFGRLHLGAINGKVTSSLVIFSALGPIIFSVIKDFTDSFYYGLYFFTLLPIIAFFMARKISLKKLY